MNAEIDAGEFREGQRRDWESASAGWRKWSELIDAETRAVAERMVKMAGIGPGDRVLDVAAGYGEPSLTAARVVGPEGSVVSSDISAGMLAYGRERAAAANIENIEFLESDAASLDLPEQSFDAALSRFGIIFEPDGEGAAARIRGFLKPGGRMAIASWGQPEQVPFIAIPMAIAIQRLNVPPPPPGTPGPLSRPTPEALGGLLEGGGFSDVQMEDAEVTMQWQSPEDFTTFVKEIAPPIRAIIDPHSEEIQDETWQAITDAIRQQAADDGTVNLTNLVLMASGRA
jgi:SAM-dependent methyltransferase